MAPRVQPGYAFSIVCDLGFATPDVTAVSWPLVLMRCGEVRVVAVAASTWTSVCLRRAIVTAHEVAAFLKE